MNPNENDPGEPEGANPYAPPSVVNTLQPPPSGPRFVAEGRRLLAGQGATWFGEAWALFKEAPGMWILFTVILFVGSLLLGFIPLGGLAMSVISPVLVGGIMLGCTAVKQGEALELGHLFAGFSAKPGPLLLLGLLYLVGTVAIVVVVFAVVVASVGFSGFASLLGAGAGDPFASIGSLLVGGLFAALVGLALLVPLMMAFWFATPLVLFHSLEPLAAIRASFNACLKNITAFLVYGLIGLVLAIAASIPFMLGWLVLVPVTMASIYTGYRDVFFEA